MTSPANAPPRFLVTAGSTREAIDEVREWRNIFTGNTGLSIARALTLIGDVHLLTSNREHLAEIENKKNPCLMAESFVTHADLKAALASQMREGGHHGVFMSAAVSDYRPEGVYEVMNRQPAGEVEQWTVRRIVAQKVKGSFEQIAVAGERTEKLIDLFRTAWGFAGMLVKFKLEVGITEEQLLRIGHQSRLASGADYLVANTLAMVSGPNPGAYLLSAEGDEWVERDKLAERLAELARDFLTKVSGNRQET